ncbi:MAG: hypothetical protein IPN32_06935 [Deltaproteobacteria bacterium]|nr:hypothetical protein [Deltaproteobacteria bacterium]
MPCPRLPFAALWACACVHAPAPSTPPSPGPSVPDGASAMHEGAEYLRLDAELDALYPLRAKMVRTGPLYLERAGTPVADGGGRSITLELRVLDDDAHGDPPRPRVLCETAGERVAVFVDEAELGVVARDGAVMVAQGSVPDTLLPTATGVALDPGALLQTRSSLDGELVHVGLDRGGLSVWGWVRRDRVGRAFRPAPHVVESRGRAATVQPGASIFAFPGGLAFGEVDAHGPPVIASSLTFVADDHRFVRFDVGDALVVGWVLHTAVVVGNPPAPPPTPAMQLGTTRVDDDRPPQVQLPRGTLLQGTALRRSVGVVLEEHGYHCVRACESAQPVVAVPACGATLELTAASVR